MAAPLSIIIPTLNAAQNLPPLLETLMEGVAFGMIAEVIFADGGSIDETAKIADATGATMIACAKGRGTQLIAGANAAKSQWLLVLHSDTRLPPDWCNSVHAHCDAHPNSAAAFHLKFDSTHPMAAITAGWANLRSRLFGLPYGDQGLLIPAPLYKACGGYPDIPLMEDVVIARRLRGKLRLLPATVTTSASAYENRGWIRRGTSNLVTLIRFALGADPKALARRYKA